MRLRLLSTILAMMLTGAALAKDFNADPGPVYTLSCTAAPLSVTVACFIERPVLTFGGFEVAIGVDARAAFLELEDASVAAYGILAYYAPNWNAWLEVALPEVIPPIGRVDPVRLGFTLRF